MADTHKVQVVSTNFHPKFHNAALGKIKQIHSYMHVYWPRQVLSRAPDKKDAFLSSNMDTREGLQAKQARLRHKLLNFSNSRFFM